MVDLAMEEEECGGSRADNDEDEDQLSEEDSFSKSYWKLKIGVEELPQFDNKNLVYLNQKPAFVVAWLQNHLRNQLANKEVFLTGFPSEIEGKSYTIEYDENTHQLNAKLVFVIDDEDETELHLTGLLHRSSKNEISVDWRPVEGTPFWLSAIQNSLNASLRLIA